MKCLKSDLSHEQEHTEWKNRYASDIFGKHRAQDESDDGVCGTEPREGPRQSTQIHPGKLRLSTFPSMQ